VRASIAASALLSRFWTAGRRDSRVLTRPGGVLFSATTAPTIAAREGCDRSRGTGMRTVVIALASIVALASSAISTAPAYAQMRGKGGKHSGSEQQTAEQKQKAAEAEKAYKAALDRIPDKKKSDPWGSVR
jgi:hypothetical protein